MKNPSITSWNRLEPKQRSSDYGLALQSKLHDPLWMLARQWQVGEFEGEDAASPVKVDVDASFVHLKRFSSKPFSDPVEYNPDSLPLEVAVEKEVIEFSTLDYRMRAELGNEFLKFISANNINSPDRRILLVEVGFPDDNSMSGYPFLKKSIDAVKLMTAGANQLSEAFGNPDNDLLQRLEETLTVWKRWARKTIFGNGHDSAWNPERQEYAFSVAAPGFDEPESEITLSGEQYPGGHLDWPSFSLAENRPLGASEASGSSASRINHELIPMPVEIPGMPSQRWWEFDDNNVDFGTLETAPQDIARMLLAHFALLSGTDWFSIPIELPVGSLTKMNHLRVTNTFGEVFDIQHSSADSSNGSADYNSTAQTPWRMFHISSDSDDYENAIAQPFLFLPPALGPSLHSEPIEEVRFIRDEMVNAAWIIERVVPNKTTGGLVDRHEKYHNLEPGFSSDPINSQEILTYKLTSDVPDYWFPLLHVQDKSINKLYLGSILRDPNQPSPELLGEISNELKDAGIFDEEVPREGINVYRQFQFARWHDGSSHLWISRRKTIGRGEGSSNLKFDSIDLNE